MNLQSKKKSLLILGLTSLIFSRTMFALFNDSEGPNLLIVIVAAAILYLLTLGVYLFFPSNKLSGLKKLLSVILIQIVIVAGFYFWLS